MGRDQCRLVYGVQRGVSVAGAMIASKPFRENAMTRKIALALAAAVIVLGSSACNTVRGVGNDLESAANSVDRAI